MCVGAKDTVPLGAELVSGFSAFGLGEGVCCCLGVCRIRWIGESTLMVQCPGLSAIGACAWEGKVWEGRNAGDTSEAHP